MSGSVVSNNIVGHHSKSHFVKEGGAVSSEAVDTLGGIEAGADEDE